VVVLSIGDFIGRFHPVLVHLPIGILLVAVLFYFLSGQEKYKSVAPAISIALFIGMCSAIASSISGFLLSKTAAYEEPLLSRHQWSGIATTVVAVAAWVLYSKQFRQLKGVMLLLSLLIIITGHFGGSLTHGDDYLFASGDKNKKPAAPHKLIPDVQQAVAYTDIIKPLLQAKCYSCHGTAKQKGKLRLDEPDYILQGGKNGKIFIAGNTGESELLQRIVLPHDNKEHMPPKEKPQLTKDEIALLHWWINTGASFTEKVTALPQPANIKPVLAALQSGKKNEEVVMSYIPEAEAEKADETAIKKLRERGVAITSVAQTSNYLAASFIAVDSITIKDVELLIPLSKQLIWLKLGNSNCTDAAMDLVGKLTGLTRLSLENTAITDSAFKQLKSLNRLQYLNVAGNTITAAGLEQLKDIKPLKNLYVYKTGVSAAGFASLKKVFPQAVIDTGGYKVPVLSTDTTLVTSPK
jgi:uncharacterized membrane protein/mono/diheme cytochrome c family protein